jgi:hypothetical protein
MAVHKEPMRQALLARDQERVDAAGHLVRVTQGAPVAHARDHVGDPPPWCGRRNRMRVRKPKQVRLHNDVYATRGP